jgi:hemolysin activation/secretion protein
MISPRVILLLTVLFQGSLHAQVLPPPPVRAQGAPRLPADQELPTATRLFVRTFQFEGNRAFSDAELSQVTGSYTNRELGIEDLEQARRAVSLFYINHGFVNSGALIPDQDPTNGIIRLQIVEGLLTGIELSGNHWLHDNYIKSRLRRWSAPPLNLNRLQDGLQLLRQNPNVRQINAELKPGTSPGEGVLDVRVADQQPFQVGIQVDNQRPPSVGAEEIWALASDQNLTGNSDRLDLRYGIANADTDGMEFSGVDNLAGSYLLPLTRYDTTLGLNASRLNTGLIEETFAPLDIESLTTSYGVVLRQPIYQTAHQELAFSIGFDHRENETSVLGEPYNLSPGAVNGETIVSVLRLSQEWLHRGQNHVLALRSTFNLGLDVWDATHPRSDVRTNGVVSRDNANAKFFSWLGQGQYVRRLFNTQNELILRVAGQYTDEPLPALEQFSVGGVETVRGYVENQLVRDRGIVSSVGFRVPIFFDKTGAGIVHLAPFYDFGGAWNVKGSARPTTISSVGMGLLLTPSKHFSAQLYWGHQLRDIKNSDHSGLQENGIHFKVNVMAF